MDKEKGRPHYPAIAAAAEKHKPLEAEKKQQRRKRISQRRIIDPACPGRRNAFSGRRVFAADRRLVDHGPGCRGRSDKAEKKGFYAGPDRRRLKSFYPGIGRRSTDKPDKPLEEHHASGRQLAKDQGPHETAEEYHRRKAIESEETHPGYVKGADKSVKEGIRELSRRLLEESKIRTAELLFGIPISELKAEVKHFTEVIRSTERIKPDAPIKIVEQLKAVPARCDNCLFYAPTVFGVTSSGAPLPTTIGECQRQAPMLNGSVVFPVVWPTMFESDWCGEHKRKV